MLEINVNFEGLDKVVRRLKEIDTHVLDMQPIWPEVKKEIWRYQNEYLGTSGFGTFAPLKASTLRKQNRFNYRRSPRPFDTGYHSTWDSFTGMGPYTYIVATKDHLSIGVARGPAHWHQVPRKFMDARPLVRMTTMLAGRIANVIKGYIVGKRNG